MKSFTSDDILMYAYILKSNLPFMVLTNKADKIAVTKVDASVLEIKKELCLGESEVIIPFSAERKIYTENAWKNLGYPN